MNRYESVLLDKMVEIRRNGDPDQAALLLLDCIVDFREPPKGLEVTDGYGAMAVPDAEV